MISKGEIKLITRFQQKKYRDAEGFFCAETPKVISEFLQENFLPKRIFSTDPELFSEFETTKLTPEELQKISSLRTANTCFALLEKPKHALMETVGLTLALDGIRDPGNLGTLIRLCDWFGISTLLCSQDTADCYNPKVVQASMGSLARVSVHYLELEDYLTQSKLPKYGGFMNGTSVYSEKLKENAILVLGNEANGVSTKIEVLIENKISIPRFGNLQKTESLNVATAAAILLHEFRRPIEM